MTAMKLGSLFDGSGGFPLAGSLCGIEPVWAAEVEPYPIAVTRSRFPNMKHLGSVTDINGGDIEPVDIITFGSPCQDLSVAGKRAGLKHEANGDEETTRSGLFMEAVRIIKEMREATKATKERTSEPSSKNLSKSSSRQPLCLRFRRTDGPTQTVIAVTDGALLTELTMLNTGECPSAAVESTLSSILEVNAPEKYRLSAKACEGILRRSKRRGKELPEMLRIALEQTIRWCVNLRWHTPCKPLESTRIAVFVAD